MTRIAIYTAIYGEKDKLREPISYDIDDEVDYFVFSDKEISNVYPYKTVELSNTYTDVSKMSKYIKINIINTDFFLDYDLIIWHDANMQINHPELVSLALKHRLEGLTMFKHHRSCVYAEGIGCIKANKDSSFKIFFQTFMNYLRGMPLNFGLWAGGILIINIKNKDVVELMKHWWKETKRYTRRDQLSLPFVVFKNKFKINELNENIYENFYLNYFNHSNSNYIDINNRVYEKDSESVKKFFIVLIKILRKFKSL